MQKPIQEKQHKNGFLLQHPCKATIFILHLNGFLPEHNIFHGGLHLYAVLFFRRFFGILKQILAEILSLRKIFDELDYKFAELGQDFAIPESRFEIPAV